MLILGRQKGMAMGTILPGSGLKVQGLGFLGFVGFRVCKVKHAQRHLHFCNPYPAGDPRKRTLTALFRKHSRSYRTSDGITGGLLARLAREC